MMFAALTLAAALTPEAFAAERPSECRTDVRPAEQPEAPRRSGSRRRPGNSLGHRPLHGPEHRPGVGPEQCPEMQPAGPQHGRRKAGYVVDRWNVYYRGRKVEGASAASFKNLGGGYGKDAWSVFYGGMKIGDAATLSFEYLGGGYAKDAWSVFYSGVKIGDAAVHSFEYLGDGCAKDAWNHYHCGRKVSFMDSFGHR